MRNLLHHILSGREFGVHAAASGYSIVCDQTVVSKVRGNVTRNTREGKRDGSSARETNICIII